MKKISIILALAAAAAVSCEKTAIPENDQVKGGRILSISFNGIGNKTAIAEDGVTPSWASGDQIWLSDGTSSQTVQVSNIKSDGSAEISTSLEGTLYAVYPATCAPASASISSGKVNVTIPSNQDGGFANANICTAQSDGNSLKFKNVTALLRIDAKSVSIASASIAANGISGTLSVSAADGNSTAAGATNSITVSLSGKAPYYIAVAPTSLAAGTVFSYKAANDSEIGSMTTSAANNLEKNTIYNLGAIVQQGAVKGVFSVSDTKKVAFSCGNLQYQASSKSWKFAQPQYSYIGNAAGNNTQSGRDTQADWVDLFGWGASGYDNTANDSYAKHFQPWDITKETVNSNDNYYGYGPSVTMTDPNLVGTSANYDWGVYNAISNGGNKAGLWRTPTSDEWVYLLNTRTVEKRFAKAAVNGVNCMILFPDSFSMPAGVTEPESVNTTGADYALNKYSAEDWAKLEAAGCVLLPACGYRMINTSGYYYGQAASSGYYWSSTFNSKAKSYRLYFSKSSVTPGNGGEDRYYGESVRLVCELD